MLDEELCEMDGRTGEGEGMSGWNNDVRFYASGIRLWAVGGIHLFFLLKVVVAVTKECTVRSAVVVDILA